MTFVILRALHAIIGEALDEIERVYADPANAPPTPTTATTATTTTSSGSMSSTNLANSPLSSTSKPSASYASPPPSPSVPSFPPQHPLDFPALDEPYDPNSPSEALTAHPTVVAAISRIVAAAGHMTATIQTPFLTLCDASMGYHLPSCMRLLEASHTVEILRDAGPAGMHVKDIAERNGVECGKLAHILRLLATHHILLERSPDVFATNRISSLVDSGKEWEICVKNPERKYENTDGIAAFVGLCTDELQKSSAYLTEAYLLSPQTTHSRDPTHTPFNFALGCEGVGFFGWLEGEQPKDSGGALGAETGPGRKNASLGGVGARRRAQTGRGGEDRNGGESGENESGEGMRTNENQFRLERFGNAMSGTGSWEAPRAVLTGFEWNSLSPGSTIVDVGGGIGSTSMMLAGAFADMRLKFIVQDRSVVVDMGEKAWHAKCPELLESGTVRFQVHDFFTPQPIKNASVFFLRVVLHDWPDVFAQRILLRLREAATDQTKLVLADFVLPLACVDDFGSGNEGRTGNGSEGEPAGGIEGVEGAERMLAPAPLLANLGKASANAYWMDLTMQVTFNGQERTLREIVALACSAGWKVIKVTRAIGSLFGYIVAVPAPIPMQRRARAGSGSAFFDMGSRAGNTSLVSPAGGGRPDDVGGMGTAEQTIAGSRSGTPTFGSRMDLPSIEEAMARFGGGIARGSGVGRGGLKRPVVVKPAALKQAAVLTPNTKKKKPSPLSVPPSSPSYRPLASPRQTHPTSPIARRMSQTPLYRPQSQSPTSPTFYQPQQPVTPRSLRQPPLSPMSPRHPHTPITRRSSYANLSQAEFKKWSGSTVDGIEGENEMGNLSTKATPGDGANNIGEQDPGGTSLMTGASLRTGGAVLAAAAKIEQRLPKSRFP